MKFVTFLIMIWLQSINVHAQEIDCSTIKTGVFQNIDNGKVTTEIRRTKKFQFEKFGAIKIKLRVVWLSDCSYKLEFIEGNDAYWGPKGVNSRPTPDLMVRITGVDGNRYTQESVFVGGDNYIYKSTIVKID